tara:strand:+ start:1169 stop:1951 length:783 start_codon:yes stop_codon:yes gene_type:complete
VINIISTLRYYFWSWFAPYAIVYISLVSFIGQTQDLVISTLIIGTAIKAYKKWSVHFINDTRSLDIEIDDLFNTSNYFLYIVSPYFNVGENRLKNIINAQKNGCDVTILIHRNALNDTRSVDELKKLYDVGCDIYIHPHLHSKIYVNETEAITGSINLLKGSFDNSLEMGVRTQDVDDHKEILSTVRDVYLFDDEIEKFNPDEVQQGYCIKTKEKINYNTKYPIKYEVYKSSDDKNGEYCHKCGKVFDTTVSDPLCDEHK